MNQIEVESGKTGCSSWGLRETLLACILPATEKAETGEELKAELWANADLRGHLENHRTNCLVSRKKILNSLPVKWQNTVKDFLSEFLETGGRMPC